VNLHLLSEKWLTRVNKVVLKINLATHVYLDLLIYFDPLGELVKNVFSS
jgi:hypothetical protein